MFRSKMLRILALVLALGLVAAACGDDGDSSDSASEETSAPADDTASDDTMMEEEDTAPVDSSTICEPTTSSRPSSPVPRTAPWPA